MTAPQFASDAAFHAVYFTADGKPQAAGATHLQSRSRRVDGPAGRRPGGELLPRGNRQHDRGLYQGTRRNRHCGGPRRRTGRCGAIRSIWRIATTMVYTVPPPSSGGVVLEMLGMLATGPFAGLGVNSPPYLARLIEVMRQGFIDRAAIRRPGVRERAGSGTAVAAEDCRGSRPRVSSYESAAGGSGGARSRHLELRDRGQGGERGRCDDDGKHDFRREADGARRSA